jgi:hypothetical protein
MLRAAPFLPRLILPYLLILLVHLIEYVINLSLHLLVVTLSESVSQELSQAHFSCSFFHQWHAHQAIDGAVETSLKLDLLNAFKVFLKNQKDIYFGS